MKTILLLLIFQSLSFVSVGQQAPLTTRNSPSQITSENQLNVMGIGALVALIQDHSVDLRKLSKELNSKDVIKEAGKEYPPIISELRSAEKLQRLSPSERFSAVQRTIATIRSNLDEANRWQLDIGMRFGELLSPFIVQKMNSGQINPSAIDEAELRANLKAINDLINTAPKAFPTTVLSKFNELASLSGVNDLLAEPNLSDFVSKLQNIFVTLTSNQAVIESNNQTVTPEVQKAQEAVNKVLEDSGRYFRDGLQAFKENRRSDAGQNFDKSVEVFLYSTLNIQRDGKLSGCYNQLIETVYRVEFPTDVQQPKVRELSATCGWAWNADDLKLADDVVSLARSVPNLPDNATTSIGTKNAGPRIVPVIGFNEQQVDPSPLDDLAKLELTPEEDEILKNGYSSPRVKSSVTRQVKVVKAVAGDTVAKVAARNGADATEVAKFNGLLPNSVLGAGREIKIPGKFETVNEPIKVTVPGQPTEISAQFLGPKPLQAKDGKVGVVISYFNEFLNDPYSMRILRWSPVVKSPIANQYYWAVIVKYRAKNLMGAYVLTEEIYYIRNNRVIRVLTL